MRQSAKIRQLERRCVADLSSDRKVQHVYIRSLNSLIKAEAISEPTIHDTNWGNLRESPRRGFDLYLALVLMPVSIYRNRGEARIAWHAIHSGRSESSNELCS